MKNISINIEEVPRSTERYSIGYAGESNATTVTFVATAWREAYPNGVFSLLIKRPDDYCYPCAISEQGGIVTYLVSAADVSIHGFGKLELQITEDDAIEKSATIHISIEESLGEGGAVPPEDASWVAAVLEASRNAEQSADASEEAATASVEAADAAAQSLSELQDLADQFIGQYLVSISGETLSMTRLSS